MATLPQSLVNLSAGAGDLILFNQGGPLRQLLHVDGGVDTCSGSYKTGKLISGVALTYTAYGLVTKIVGAGNAARALYLTSKLALSAESLEDLTVAEQLTVAIEASSEAAIESSINVINAAAKIIPKAPIIW